MATKPLKSIKFPGLPDTYTIPQVDSTPTQGSANAVSSGGVYEALQIVEHQISPTWMEGGTISKATGEFAVNSDLNWTYTQFYEISKSSKIRLSVYASGSSAGVAFYDSNKTFISGTSVTSKTNTDLREYNVPINAVFVRFTNNVASNYHPDTPLIILLRDKADTIVDEIIAEIPQVDTTPTQNSTNAVSSGGVYEAFTGVADDIDELVENTFLHIDGNIDTPAIVFGSWARGGAVDGGNRGRTEYLLKLKGSLSFGLGDYSKYKFGYMIYTSPDLSQYTNSGWVTADVLNLDFSAYAIGFSFAHLSGSGMIPQSELKEIQSLFTISGSGYLFSLREEITSLQSEVDTLESEVESLEGNPLPRIGANPLRIKRCYDHLFVNSKTDAVIPHESLYHIRVSKKFGFDVIEANVSVTSDGVYVVNHLENYKFGGYFHHVDGTTDISDILLSSVTWDWVVENVRYNSTIPKYRTRPCRLEEFLQECRQQDLIPFITSSDTNVIAIADQYMGKDNYIAYGASREDCPHAIIYHWVSSLTTKEAILAYCENIGKPFIFGLGNVERFTDAGLKELVETLHENGYMISISYSDNNVHKYSAFGFDTIGTIRHINRIREGNLCNLNSVFNFSDFEYTNATLSNGILTFSSAGTIKPKIESINYPFCGFDIEFDMTGTVTIPAVGEQKTSYNLNSDGSYPVFCATPIINGSPAITINVASGTVIRDVFFKASVF